MHKTISIWDLLSVEEIKASIQAGDEETFLKQMYFLGFDTAEKIEQQDCYHYSMINGNNKVFGKLYRGKERTDPAWLNSRSCTLENKIELAVEKDESFGDELKSMSEMPNLAEMNASWLRGELHVFPEEMIKNNKESNE